MIRLSGEYFRSSNQFNGRNSQVMETTLSNFVAVIKPLKQGQRVRKSNWESSTVAFLDGKEFVCQRTSGSKPYSYNLSWHEIAANDWSVIETAPAA